MVPMYLEKNHHYILQRRADAVTTLSNTERAVTCTMSHGPFWATHKKAISGLVYRILFLHNEKLLSSVENNPGKHWQCQHCDTSKSPVTNSLTADIQVIDFRRPEDFWPEEMKIPKLSLFEVGYLITFKTCHQMQF